MFDENDGNSNNNKVTFPFVCVGCWRFCERKKGKSGLTDYNYEVSEPQVFK